LIEKCIEVIRSEQKASVSMMQRRLRLGYTRAARIMDELERRGVVGPSKGAEPREILIDLDGGGADGGGQELV
jgi:S-DNA-T family DNA segregation ATPase FtsK/SpoIIIE